MDKGLKQEKINKKNSKPLNLTATRGSNGPNQFKTASLCFILVV